MFASQASSSSACNSIPIRATATFGAIHRLLAALVPMLLAPTASALTVSPNPLVLSVRAGESATFPVQLANPAASAVDWTLKFVDANGSANTLEAAMARLSASGTSLNGPLPNRVDFAGGETGTSIATGVASGGLEIFTSGNQLTTSLGGPQAITAMTTVAWRSRHSTSPPAIHSGPTHFLLATPAIHPLCSTAASISNTATAPVA